jgi:oligoribonuclease (3'-5' exoribonuclease)
MARSLPPPQDPPINNKELQIGALDTETGGLNHDTDGLISVAIIPPKELKDLRPLEVLIAYNKNLNYDHQALEVNGFYPILDKEKNEFFWWMTEGGKRRCIKGMEEQGALDTIITYLEVYFKNAFIAGANIEFDKSFLLSACKRIDKNNETSPTNPKSFQKRLENCLLRKTIELQTLALCAHMQNQITLPYTRGGTKEKTTSEPPEPPEPPKSSKGKGAKKTEPLDNQKTHQRPSVSLNSIAKAISKKTGETIIRESEKHSALEDALITLKLAQELTKPWEPNLNRTKKETKKENKEENYPHL